MKRMKSRPSTVLWPFWWLVTRQELTFLNSPYKVPPPPVFSVSSLLFCPFPSPLIRTWITRNVSLQELPQDFTTRPLLYGTVEIHKVMLPMGYGWKMLHSMAFNIIMFTFHTIIIWFDIVLQVTVIGWLHNVTVNVVWQSFLDKIHKDSDETTQSKKF